LAINIWLEPLSLKREIAMTDLEKVERFREMADHHTAQHTVSKQAALDELVAEGIYTEDGKLTPEYRGAARTPRRRVAAA